MKYSILSILTLMLCSVYTFELAGQSRLGLLGGVNLTTAQFNNTFLDVTSPTLRHHIGVFASFPLSKQFNLEGVALYSWKGWRFSATDSGKMNLHYLDFQLLGRYLFTKPFSIA
ncbi:MAG: outer membrane beta-barrel protein, partial [Bacteroidota bacterium]